jgi:PAS domain S-box-containing protein
VIFEDVFLFISCRQATCEMWDIAHRTAELEESQQSEHAIIEAALDAVVQMDMEGQVVGWNSQAAETFGWSASEACGSSLAELIIPPSVRNRHDQGLLHYRGTGEGPILNKRIEVTARHRDGHDLPVELAIAPIHFNGQTRFCAFVNDITRRREAEDALKRAKEAAENANRAKSDFLANISHEIRTPLNSILGFSDLLLRGEDQGEQAQRIDFVRSIHQSSQHLLGLINDLLDLSKIEAGQFQVDVQRCSPAQMIAEVVSSLRVRALETQLRLEYTWLTGIPETIATDPARLRQVLMNLVGNAIKFTHSGHVRIAARIDFQPGDPRLVIEVEDTGIGIADEHCDKIFAPFVQADSSVTREFGGTGLGLSIAKAIVDAHGGSIAVESKEGHGATFRICLTGFRPSGPDGSRPFERPTSATRSSG